MLNSAFTTVVNFVKRLTDLRFLGQVIFVIIVILVSWSTARAILANYDFGASDGLLENFRNSAA